MEDIKEIKFRGRIINDVFCKDLFLETKIGNFAYGNLIVADNGDCFITSSAKTIDAGYESEAYKVDPETVSQYTGLKDKKKTKEYPDGQEIYGGDLFYYHGVLRKVVYRKDVAAWMGVVVKDNCGSCNFYLRNIIDDCTMRLDAEII